MKTILKLLIASLISLAFTSLSFHGYGQTVPVLKKPTESKWVKTGRVQTWNATITLKTKSVVKGYVIYYEYKYVPDSLDETRNIVRPTWWKRIDANALDASKKIIPFDKIKEVDAVQPKMLQLHH